MPRCFVAITYHNCLQLSYLSKTVCSDSGLSVQCVNKTQEVAWKADLALKLSCWLVACSECRWWTRCVSRRGHGCRDDCWWACWHRHWWGADTDGTTRLLGFLPAKYRYLKNRFLDVIFLEIHTPTRLKKHNWTSVSGITAGWAGIARKRTCEDD